jgi:hypothetical protein
VAWEREAVASARASTPFAYAQNVNVIIVNRPRIASPFLYASDSSETEIR